MTLLNGTVNAVETVKKFTVLRKAIYVEVNFLLISLGQMQLSGT